MEHKLQVLQKLILCVLLWGSCSMAHAQSLAAYNKVNPHPIDANISGDQDENMKSLESVLNEMKAKFQISLNYDFNAVEGKTVNNEALQHLKSEADIEKSLSLLLSPFNLQYEKLKDDYYVIFNKEKKVKKIEKKTLNMQGEQKGQVEKQATIEKLQGRAAHMQAWLDKTITGKVTDENQEGLPGVNIVVKGSTLGTVTDVDGNYRLNTPDDAQTLVFSSVGYETQEVAIGNQANINLSMTPDVRSLSEVVVVGYGAKKKEDVVGSISTISGEEITQTPYASFDASLQGRGAGIQVVSSGGTPGAQSRVLIRGTNSLSLSTEPLYIVDGMPISTQTLGIGGVGSATLSPLATINPNDIKSIEVLKDAAATSIYGSRGSNGVILITTKSGEQGKGNIDFSFSGGISDLSRQPEDIGFTTSKQYFELMDAARANSGLTPMTPGDIINTWAFKTPGDTLSRAQAENINTDWFDEIMQKGSFQDYNLSLTMGGAKSQTYASLNYRKDNGMLKHNSLERYAVRINSDFTPVENLNAGFRFSLSYVENDRAKDNNAGSTSGTNGNGGGFSQLNWNVMPWFLVHSDNDPTGYWNAPSGFNPAASQDPALVRDEAKSYRGLGGIFLQYNLPWVQGLSVRTELSADIIQTNSWNAISSSLRDDKQSFVQETSQTVNNFNYNLYGIYNRSFGKHNVTVTAGTESQSYFVNGKYMAAKGVNGSYQQIGEDPLVKLSMNSTISNERYLRSFFGRAGYKFNDRYIIEGSLRSDASSVFPEENQWATFKALGLGWIISDESFWPSQVVNLLKLRGSFGQTGNQSIPSEQYKTNYSNIGLYGNSDTPEGSGLSTIATPLRWETTNNYDVGIDYGLFQNRISGSVAYFVHNVEDMLLETSIPLSSGTNGNRLWQNIGDMRNSGFEFEINAFDILKGDFKWNSSFNLTLNSNKIESLTAELDNSGNGLSTLETLTKTGGRVGAYYLSEYAGVDPQHGVEMIYEIDQERFEETRETVKTGRVIPATSENMRDNKILNEDKTGLPTYWGGFNNTFSYKGFDLNVFITFQGGNYLFDYGEKYGTTPQRGQYRLRSDLVGNTWTAPGDVAAYPQLRWDQSFAWNMDENYEWVNESANYNNETFFHDKYLHKGDFIRFRNIQLGYNLPANVLSRIKMQSVRIYVSGTNLFTFTQFDGYDPEVVSNLNNAMSSNLSPGIVSYTLPNLKIYSLGVNLKF